jgi:catechol 2,3-dioxygenase-like lactoylglutathione lyase family enzyme
MQIWYQVKDLDRAERFYVDLLGFQELYRDENDRWMRLARNGVEVHIAESDVAKPDTDTALAIEVEDVKAEAARLREAGANVGVVLEIPGTIRILDVFDPDGNRIQLTQDV